VKLNLDQLFDLSVSLEKTGPMELKRLMTLFQKRKESKLGSTLVRSLTRSAAATSLHTDQLKTQLASFGTEVVVEAEPLIAKIEQQTAEKITVIEKVLQLSEKGDARRGQQVFHSTKTACASCHAVGYLGGDIGPDLTRIGRIRTNRDILEAILFPNVSFVRSFEPTVIITNDGQVHNGVVKNETNQEIVLALDAQKIIRIPQNKVEQRYPSTVSIMPEGLEKQLSLQDVADLLTFLRTANN
jgi:putative heme-binding domain-containing protein